MKTTVVSTWLPLFSGFYETIWNGDGHMEREIDYVNEQRKEKGLEPVKWDAFDWDYENYSLSVVRGVTNAVGEELRRLMLIKAFKFEKLSSPKEYNFATDAIHVEMTVTPANAKKIKAYLDENVKAFASYLKDRYTSYDGFLSGYSNDVEAWMEDFESVVTHQHQLGSILEFILSNEDQLTEEDIFGNLSGNGVILQAKNYSELVGG